MLAANQPGRQADVDGARTQCSSHEAPAGVCSPGPCPHPAGYLQVPRPNFFARPYGPYQAIPLMYTADPEGTGDVITTTPDTADAM
jgi:hypothetical protein